MFESFKINYEFNELLKLIEELIKNDNEKLRLISRYFKFSPDLQQKLVQLIKVSKELEGKEVAVDGRLKKNLSILVKEGRLAPEYLSFVQNLDKVLVAQRAEDETQIRNISARDFTKIVAEIRQDIEKLQQEKLHVRKIEDARTKAMQRPGKLIEIVEINGVKYVLKTITHFASEEEKEKAEHEIKKEIAASLIGQNLVNIARVHSLNIDDIEGSIKETLKKLNVRNFMISELIDNDFKVRLPVQGQKETLFVFYNLIGDFDKLFNAHNTGMTLVESFKKFEAIISKETGTEIRISPEKIANFDTKLENLRKEEQGLNNLMQVKNRNGEEALVTFDHGDLGTRWEESDRGLWISTDFSKLNLQIPAIVKAVGEFRKLDLQALLREAGFKGEELEKTNKILKENQKNLARMLIERFATFHGQAFAETLQLHLKRSGLL